MSENPNMTDKSQSDGMPVMDDYPLGRQRVASAPEVEHMLAEIDELRAEVTRLTTENAELRTADTEWKSELELLNSHLRVQRDVAWRQGWDARSNVIITVPEPASFWQVLTGWWRR